MVPERRVPFRPAGAQVVMQFYCHEAILAISTAIIPTTKNNPFLLPSGRLDDRDAAVVYLEAH